MTNQERRIIVFLGIFVILIYLAVQSMQPIERDSQLGKVLLTTAVNIISTNSPNVAFTRAIIEVKASAWYMENTSK